MDVIALLRFGWTKTQQNLVEWFHSFFTQNIVDAMAGSKNWKAAAKDSKLDKMHTDITKIVADF